jgi:hypothetical protein
LKREEVVAAQDPTETARLERGDSFVDPSVNAFHGEVSVNEDRFGTGEWRVEYFDDDGGCYVTYSREASARLFQLTQIWSP